MELEKIKGIYPLLGDDISRCIFENRLMYSLTEIDGNGDQSGI